MEHLFMQIFDRRRWIEGQLRPQIDSYVQSLAYNLLADGRQPPPWLLAARSDAPNVREPKEMVREQLISEILLPLPRTTTPTNHSTLLPLPTLKGNNVACFSSSFTEMYDPNKLVFAAQVDETLPNDHSKDGYQHPGMLDLEAAEACELDQLTGIQLSGSKQRELKNHLGSGKATNTGDSSAMDKGSGRMTRSRVALLKTDSDKESLARKNLLIDRYGDGAHKAAETQGDFWRAASLDAGNLVINSIDDVMASRRYGTGNLTKDFVSDALRPVVSGSKMTPIVTSGLSESHALVEPKKLTFDGIEDCVFDENCLSASDKNTLGFAPNVELTEMDNLQVVKKQYNCIYSTKEHDCLAGTLLLKDVFHTAENMEDEAGKVINGSPKGHSELHEGGDSDCHCCPPSCSNPSHISALSSMRTTYGVSETGVVHFCPTRGSMLESDMNFSAHPSFQNDVSQESSSQRLVKYTTENQNDELLRKVLSSVVACRQNENITLVELKHHLSDTIQQHDSKSNSAASLPEETEDNEIIHAKLETLQKLKEKSFHREANAAHVSSANGQHQQDDVLPDELMGAEEVDRIASESHEQILDLVDRFDSECNFEPSLCNNIPSKIPAMVSVEVISGNDVGRKFSMGRPNGCTIEQNCKGPLMIETSGSHLQLIGTVCSNGSALSLPQTTKNCVRAEEAEASAVELAKRNVALLILTPDAAANHNECQPPLRSSYCSGSCELNKPVLPSLNQAAKYLSAQENVVNVSNSDAKENFIFRKTPNVFGASNFQQNAHHYLRSSTGSGKNLGARKANAFISPSPDENIMQQEANKDETFSGEEDDAEKNASRHTVTPRDIETQNTNPGSRYFLRSLTDRNRNLAFQLKGTNDANSPERSAGTTARACAASWPKKRKIECGSNNVLATSPRMRLKTLLCIWEGSDKRCNASLENASRASTETSSSLLATEIQTGLKPLKNQNLLPGSRYFLRRLASQDKIAASSKSNGVNDSSSLKQLIEPKAHAWKVSWPKRRMFGYRSNNILATSPRMRLKSILNSQKGCNCRSKVSSENAVGAGTGSSFLPSVINPDTASATSGSPFRVLHQCKKQCDEEGSTCLEGKNLTVSTLLPLESTQEDQFPNLSDRSPQTSLTNQWKATESTVRKLKEHGTAEYCHDLFSSCNKLNCELPKNVGYTIDSTEEKETCNAGRTLYADDASKFFDGDFADCDGTIPVFEGFSIGIPSNMEDGVFYDSDVPMFDTEQTSMLEQQSSSRNLVAQRSCPSSKYKINRIPDFYQSLPTGLLEHFKFSDSLHFKDSDIQQSGTGGNVKISRLCCNLGTEFDDFCTGRLYSHSLSSSSVKFQREGCKPPLTPPVEKFSQRNVTKRSAGSETLGSNPELICFRIDENVSTAEENDHFDELDTSENQAGSRGIKLSTNRKALQDVTAIYQNAQSSCTFERNSLESVGTESYSVNRMGANSSLRSARTSNRILKVRDKKKHTLSVNGNRVRKAAESLSNRSSKELSGKVGKKNSSRINPEKGCIPNNIVSNISSFIPLVRQKQEMTTKKGKRDIKVKALEAAEAAKRLEEKKQKERDMRKAATKLERERLEQEKELKQKKKEEEKKKKEADVAARKRQREEEERKEKARKRRCIEEARKIPRDKEERLFTNKGDKDFQRKAADQKEHTKKEVAEETNRQLISRGSEEAAGNRTIAEQETSATRVLAGNERRDNSSLEAYDVSRESNDHEESYEMSPYKDSDDDDDDDGEEEIRRRRKQVPSWARREYLEKILLSKQHLNPIMIFCRKSSFKLNDGNFKNLFFYLKLFDGHCHDKALHARSALDAIHLLRAANVFGDLFLYDKVAQVFSLDYCILSEKGVPCMQF